MRTQVALVILIVIVILGGVGFTVLSLEIFDRINMVDALCFRRPGEEEYTPDRFARENFDTTSYLIDTYETIEFPARGDEVTVSGFFIPANVSDTSATVIIAHGFNDCKRRPFSLTPASMLRDNGFNSLVIDLRNHGDSEVTTKRMTGGELEAQDILGAWDWLIGTQGIAPENIGLFGYSMGGATLIHAMADEPQIVAGWADSTFDSMDSVLQYQLQLNSPSLPTILSQPVLTIGRMANNIDLTTNTTADAVQGLDGRALHLLHSQADESVAFSSYEALATTATNAGVDLVTWEVENSGHIEHMFNDPDGYEERLIAFFSEHLNN